MEYIRYVTRLPLPQRVVTIMFCLFAAWLWIAVLSWKFKVLVLALSLLTRAATVAILATHQISARRCDGQEVPRCGADEGAVQSSQFTRVWYAAGISPRRYAPG